MYKSLCFKSRNDSLIMCFQREQTFPKVVTPVTKVPCWVYGGFFYNTLKVSFVLGTNLEEKKTFEEKKTSV